MQVISWVLGEYGSLATEGHSREAIVGSLCVAATWLSFKDPHTCGFIVSALMKLSAQAGCVCCIPVLQVLGLYSQSLRSDLQQRCLEFIALAAEGPTAMAAVLPVDASCEDVEADENLSHLDGLVSAALAAGAVPYSPPPDVDSDGEGEGGEGLGGG
ncbi:unnamed protein product, partial [Discosporangium mesarthrocarpum]